MGRWVKPEVCVDSRRGGGVSLSLSLWYLPYTHTNPRTSSSHFSMMAAAAHRKTVSRARVAIGGVFLMGKWWLALLPARCRPGVGVDVLLLS